MPFHSPSRERPLEHSRTTNPLQTIPRETSGCKLRYADRNEIQLYAQRHGGLQTHQEIMHTMQETKQENNHSKFWEHKSKRRIPKQPIQNLLPRPIGPLDSTKVKDRERYKNKHESDEGVRCCLRLPIQQDDSLRGHRGQEDGINTRCTKYVGMPLRATLMCDC